ARVAGGEIAVPRGSRLGREEADLGRVSRRGRLGESGSRDDFIQRVHIRQNHWPARLKGIRSVHAQEFELRSRPGKSALGLPGQAIVPKAGEVKRLRGRGGFAVEHQAWKIEGLGIKFARRAGPDAGICGWLRVDL